uniref:Peptide hydrolase n=1 Tax=Moniliophthora roreri TaxID=221103 RepID=A0A0W0GEW1_MONRR
MALGMNQLLWVIRAYERHSLASSSSASFAVTALGIDFTANSDNAVSRFLEEILRMPGLAYGTYRGRGVSYFTMRLSTVFAGFAFAAVHCAALEVGLDVDAQFASGPPKPPGKSRASPVEIAQLDNTLKSLYQIAVDNGGNRAFGLPGYDRSVDFIVNSIKKFDKGNHFTVWKQPFTAQFTRVTLHRFNVSDNESYVPEPLLYSPSTPVGGITAELAVVPGDAKPCNGDELAATGADVAGKILLIERGSCPDGTTFAGKVKTAKAGGALAAIIFNNAPGVISSGTLTAPNPEYVPAGLISQEAGQALRARVLAGEKLIVEYEQNQVIENRTTVNVFAETKAGDKNNLIQLGAHLDGVQAGPGINDDGSGTTLILELLRTLDAKRVKNAVRFSWWGAEENGLLGSIFHTSNLTSSEVDNILLYLNFDMVGRGVFDGDGSTYGRVAPPGSDVIEKLFEDFFAARGIPVQPVSLSGGSDYVPFLENLQKPVGGLFTGTGVDQDPCYHKACDTYDNVNQTQLLINTQAAQTVLLKLIDEGTTLIPKNLTTVAAPKVLVNLASDVDLEFTKQCNHEHEV